eukprot:gene28182-12461_t
MFKFVKVEVDSSVPSSAIRRNLVWTLILLSAICTATKLIVARNDLTDLTTTSTTTSWSTATTTWSTTTWARKGTTVTTTTTTPGAMMLCDDCVEGTFGINCDEVSCDYYCYLEPGGNREANSSPCDVGATTTTSTTTWSTTTWAPCFQLNCCTKCGIADEDFDDGGGESAKTTSSGPGESVVDNQTSQNGGGEQFDGFSEP